MVNSFFKIDYKYLTTKNTEKNMLEAMCLLLLNYNEKFRAQIIMFHHSIIRITGLNG